MRNLGFGAAAALGFLAMAASTSASAESYVLKFDKPVIGSGGAFTASGSFDYDAVNGFSNFIVHANGVDLDLTSSANSPTGKADGCSVNMTGAAYSFALLTTCNTESFKGNPDPSIGYWFTSSIDSLNYSELSFGGSAQAYGTGFLPVISNYALQASGDSEFFGSFAVEAVPEPATWAMLILGVGLIGLAARRRNAAAVVAA